jgi:5'-3' exonuclease
MDFLSKYIDWYIRKKITQDEKWKELDVYFSNEKVPGEGEHKLVNWIRKYGNDDDTYCINALDADLVMLSLGTRKRNFYLLREELYDKSFDFTYVDVGQGLRKEISNNLLYWDESDEDQIIYDFILILFLCGNDFLPNIPSISLIDKGLSTIIDIYKRCCSEKGHLVDNKGNIRIDSFTHFLHLLGQSEKSLLEDKWMHRSDYIHEPLLDECMIHLQDPETNIELHVLDFDNYKSAFYKKKGIDNIENACHSYVDGCAWVLKYYLYGVQDWSYMYPYNYSPFATDIARYMSNYSFKEEKRVPPVSPFLQLLCVIPPKSSFLLPKPIDSILTTKGVLSKYFPDHFHINYEGKKKTWEGIVELPPVDVSVLKKELDRVYPLIDKMDLKRNVPGKSFLYKKSDFISDVKSFYGNFRSTAGVEVVEF